MTPTLLQQARHVLRSQPFSEWLGAELSHIDDQSVELRLPIHGRLAQQHGFVHGGVLAYAADNAITFAAGARLGPSIVTSEMKINYVRPARGVTLVARAAILHAGRRQAVCRSEIVVIDEAGQESVCALAQGTVSVLGEPESR